MHEIILLVLGMFIGDWLGDVIKALWKQRHKPTSPWAYSWECPVRKCGFRVSANRQELIDYVMADHKDRHWKQP